MTHPLQTMSSRWNPRTPRRTPPPWCKVGLFPITPPIVAGLPSYLVALVHWRDAGPDPDVWVTSSLRCGYDATEENWSAKDPGPGYSLGCAVNKEAGANLYQFVLTLYKDSTLSEQHDWRDVPMGPDSPWKSPLMELITDATLDRQHMQIYG